MPTQTIDILHKIEKFHRNMAGLYKQLLTMKQEDKVRLILEYLEKHEKNMEDELHRFSLESHKKALESWFTYSLDEEKIRFMKTICIDDNLNIKEVVEIALMADDYLQSLYSNLTSIADNRDAKSIFTNLLQSSIHERRKFIHHANSDFH